MPTSNQTQPTRAPQPFVPPAAEGGDPASVARAYDQWAASYDSQENRTRDLDARVLRTHGPSVRGRAVLELGCGTGKNTEWFASQCREVTAMDISAGMLEVARSRIQASHVHFVEQDVLTRWPVNDATIDLVVGTLVLEHIRDLRAVFDEAARVLRKGGKLFLSELHPMRQLAGAQAHYLHAESGEPVNVPAFRHNVSEFVNTALAAGFVLRSMGEWTEEGAKPGSLPRLLTLYFVRSAS